MRYSRSRFKTALLRRPIEVGLCPASDPYPVESRIQHLLGLRPTVVRDFYVRCHRLLAATLSALALIPMLIYIKGLDSFALLLAQVLTRTTRSLAHYST
eukprot:scaffold28425_cov36-Tisochrysis_lutea.AAC.2